MMTKLIDARNIPECEGKKILFDTNIWLLIEGYSNEAKHRSAIYSAAYKAMLQRGAKIVTNDYVIGEFFNRSAKIEYDTALRDMEDERPSFKAYRCKPDFRDKMEGIRDTCLNIIDDCEFVSVSGGHYDIADVLGECSAGLIDFTDKILKDFCTKENAWLLTDDADFADCGITIVTANPRLLK